jgi:hypothetical protein
MREAIKRPSTHLECHQARCDGARGELRELRERSVQSVIGEAAGRKHEGRLATCGEVEYGVVLSTCMRRGTSTRGGSPPNVELQRGWPMAVLPMTIQSNSPNA